MKVHRKMHALMKSIFPVIINDDSHSLLQADKNKLRGYVTVGEFEGCTHYKVGKCHIKVYTRMYNKLVVQYHVSSAFKGFLRQNL